MPLINFVLHHDVSIGKMSNPNSGIAFELFWYAYEEATCKKQIWGLLKWLVKFNREVISDE